MSFIGVTHYLYNHVSNIIIYNGFVYCIQKQRSIYIPNLYMQEYYYKYLTKSKGIDSLLDDESYVLI
jgi:hypothetical protein